MTDIISSQAIHEQMNQLRQLEQDNLLEHPLLIKINDCLYAIGQPDKNDTANLYVTFATNEIEIVPQTNYDPDGWTTELTDDKPIFQFDNGYLVLTQQGYLLTPYLYEIGNMTPITPNAKHSDIELSLLLTTDELTMTTKRYKKLSLTAEEWADLSNDSLSDLVAVLLDKGIEEQTYNTEETQKEHKFESILSIDGKEHSVLLNESTREQVNDYEKQTK